MVTQVATTNNNVETSNANVECAGTIMVNAPSGLMQAPDTKWMDGNSGPRLCGRLSELCGFSAKVVAKVLKRRQALRQKVGKQRRFTELSGLRPRLAFTALHWRLRC